MISLGKYPVEVVEAACAAGEQRTIRTFHSLLQSMRSRLRHSVPEFRRTEVNVIDAEQIHILDMPSECCTPHAEIEIGCVDARKALGGSRK